MGVSLPVEVEGGFTGGDGSERVWKPLTESSVLQRLLRLASGYARALPYFFDTWLLVALGPLRE
jgi:hypothetical protein